MDQFRGELREGGDGDRLQVVGADGLLKGLHIPPGSVHITGIAADACVLKAHTAVEPLTLLVGNGDDAVHRAHSLNRQQLHQGTIQLPAYTVGGVALGHIDGQLGTPLVGGPLFEAVA